MDKNAFDLLKSWCDGLLALQVTSTGRVELDGGLLCPACGLMHGRCADLLYPLVYVYRVTNDEKYLIAAERLSDWAENNMKDSLGSYRNDVNSGWIGITAFHCDCLYEALVIGENKLPERVYNKFRERFIALSDTVYSWFDNYSLNLVTNYYAGGAACLAERFTLTGEEKYKKRSLEWIGVILERVTSGGLIYGEGYNKKGQTTEKDVNGFLQVDIGYDIEETAPFVIKVGKLLKDEALYNKGKELMRALIEFMLPDGGVDNGWGAREIKWTYYGSRTSDGIGCGLALCPEEPEFIEAAYRNLKLMEELTDRGLLFGGARYKEAGQPPCIHHAFEHAKALAAMCVSNIEYKHICELPCDKQNNEKAFPDAGITLVRRKNVIGSVFEGATDISVVSTGGLLTLLYGRKTGVIIASTAANFRLVEEKNMQFIRDMSPVYSMTPRIDKGGFSQRLSRSFNTARENEAFTVNGALSDDRGNLSDKYFASYSFNENGVVITAECDGGAFVLPIAAGYNDMVKIDGCNAEIIKDGGRIKICADKNIKMWLDKDTVESRHFTPVGGFLYAIFKVELMGKTTITITEE